MKRIDARMKQAIFIILIFISGSPFVKAQQTIVADSAFTLAREKHKMILLIFSGSDWCKECMRFEKKILRDPVFDRFADSNLIVVQADFPQSKKLAPQIIKQNENLAERYNPSGLFPLILLLRPDQQIAANLNYSNQESHDFIAMINRYLPKPLSDE